MKMARRPAALGLYVHVPFCVHKCPYCDFVSGPVAAAQRSVHLQALEGEIRNSPWRFNRAHTVFFGGGTPSELQIVELAALVTALGESFEIDSTAEWTIECNPGTLPDSKLNRLRELGFNRVSLGVQSFNDRHLKTLGRIHDGAQALDCYRRLRRAGFDNLNLDLMFAVPGQSLQDWEMDLAQAVQLAPEHLSLYNLTIEPDTEFGRRERSGELLETGENMAAAMFEMAMDVTDAAGFQQYEISNYARPGRECRHNLVYWRNREYLGFGVSAASYMGGTRWTNTSDLREYASTAASGRPTCALQESLAAREAMGESVMLGLRTSQGIDLQELEIRHGASAPPSWHQQLKTLQSEGFVSHQDGRYYLTRSGRLVGDAIASTFVAPSVP